MHTFLKVEMIRELKSHVLIQVITKGSGKDSDTKVDRY